MVLMEKVIHQIYFVMAGLIGLLLIRGFVKREKRQGLVYDIVYAYTAIPFILRALRVF